MAETYSNYQNSNTHLNPKPEDACKMFVGGLSWDTTQEKLNNYFTQFGEVIDCILMIDPTTKRSRGFGFVTYKDSTSVLKVLEYGAHILDNKTIDPKAAVPRFPCTVGNSKVVVHSCSPVSSRRCNKIFVGGIGQASEEDLRSYFQTYGNVTDVTIMMDKNTGRARGFAFVGFETVESSEQTAQLRFHTIKGKRVEVKVAQPRDAKCLEYNEDGNKIDSENLSESNEESQIDMIKNIRLADATMTVYTKNRIYDLLNDIWK